MKETRRIKIITTRRRTLRIQLPAIRAYCPVCEREVETLATTQAAEALGINREVETLAQSQAAEVLEISRQSLDDMIANGLIHTIRTVNGNLRVCKDSLFAPPF